MPSFRLLIQYTHSKNHAHRLRFVMFWFGLALVSCTHILQGCFIGTGAIEWLPQCQWRNLEEYHRQIITFSRESNVNYEIVTTKQGTKMCKALWFYGTVFLPACQYHLDDVPRCPHCAGYYVMREVVYVCHGDLWLVGKNENGPLCKLDLCPKCLWNTIIATSIASILLFSGMFVGLASTSEVL